MLDWLYIQLLLRVAVVVVVVVAAAAAAAVERLRGSTWRNAQLAILHGLLVENRRLQHELLIFARM